MKAPKFVQITSGGGRLAGLDQHGRVWVFQLKPAGDEAAWVRLTNEAQR